jgi:hypothetical protein
MENQKYSRTLHAQISLGTTSDDRFMPSGYVEKFSQKDLIITEKLDGQNNCFSKLGVFARSHVAPSSLPWDKPMWQRWDLIKRDLEDLEIEIFGENMYGIHSIAYSKLESFFYVFGVRKSGIWLSWDEVKSYANLFDFPTVPEIEISKDLKDLYDKKSDENDILRKWIHLNLGLDWEDWVETSGSLGGYDPISNTPCCEGLVIRCANEYSVNSGMINVEWNEFDSLFKLVRKKHVKTDQHWTKTWKPTKLTNYSKYKWDQFFYLG